MTKNIIIVMLLMICTSMAFVAITAHTSKNILQRDYEYLEGRYTELYLNSPITNNQD